MSQRSCLSYNRVYDLSPWIYYYYFDIIMTIESEGSESSEGIIDSRLSNKQNDDAIIVTIYDEIIAIINGWE
jgi:hypothetical protein